MEPKVNQVYRRRGFRFVVHGVKRGMVYVLRTGKESRLMRVTIKVWERDMAGAKPLGRAHGRDTNRPPVL